MSFRQDTGGAVLAFVTRVVIGPVETPKCVYNKEQQELQRTTVLVENPVIVFFPNGSCVVMAEKDADKKGFLNMPTILNFEAVTDASSIAGQFKFAMSDDQRNLAWEQMEQQVISACQARGGYPFDASTTKFAAQSLHLTGRPSQQVKPTNTDNRITSFEEAAGFSLEDAVKEIRK